MKLEQYILIIVEYYGASSSSGVIGEVTGGAYPSDDWLYSRVNQGGSCRKYIQTSQWTTLIICDKGLPLYCNSNSMKGATATEHVNLLLHICVHCSFPSCVNRLRNNCETNHVVQEMMLEMVQELKTKSSLQRHQSL